MSEDETELEETERNKRWGQTNRQEVCTGELDRRLLEILDGQIAGLAKTVNKQTTLLLLIGVLCFGMVAWMHHTQDLFQDEIRRRVADLENEQKAMLHELLAATRETAHDAERASKHVWELKRALHLRFSQERSALKDSALERDGKD